MAKCKHPGKCPMINRPYEITGTIPSSCFFVCDFKPAPETTPVRRWVDTGEIINDYDPSDYKPQN